MKARSFTNRPHLLVLGLGVMLLTQCGCLQVRSYVDPKLSRASFGDLQPCVSPLPLEVAFEFQVNGKSNTSATESLRPQMVHALFGSGLFLTVLSNSSSNGAQLHIVLNDRGSIGGAITKGIVTGLTFGGIGSRVTDAYLFTATYQSPGKQPVTKTYEHAIHTTIGLKKGPEGLLPRAPNAAVSEVLEQLTLNLLHDLQSDGAL
jgi:hypothetical protein